MARKNNAPATETLEEIDGFFDRLATWTAENSTLVWSTVGGILVLALIVSVVDVVSTSARQEASAKVGEVQADYLQAMGAPTLTATFTEPANPEAARATRETYAARLEAAANAHRGSAPAAAGYLEVAEIRARLGDTPGSIAALRAAVDDADAGTALRAVALVRLAATLEAEDAAEASRAYEQAAEIDDYPGATSALAHAARTALDAGDRDRALALFASLEAREDTIGRAQAAPPFILARLREARAAAGTTPTDATE